MLPPAMTMFAKSSPLKAPAENASQRSMNVFYSDKATSVNTQLPLPDLWNNDGRIRFDRSGEHTRDVGSRERSHRQAVQRGRRMCVQDVKKAILVFCHTTLVFCALLVDHNRQVRIVELRTSEVAQVTNFATVHCVLMQCEFQTGEAHFMFARRCVFCLRGAQATSILVHREQIVYGHQLPARSPHWWTVHN